MNTPKARVSNGMMTAHRVSNQSRSTIIPHSGMRPNWVGTIIVMSTVSNSAPRPLNFNLANANPASIEVMTTLTVTDEHTITELIRPWMKLTSDFSNARPRLSQNEAPKVNGGVGSLMASWLRVAMTMT